jgi:magnesium-transporting ATPase (P-type)
MTSGGFYQKGVHDDSSSEDDLVELHDYDDLTQHQQQQHTNERRGSKPMKRTRQTTIHAPNTMDYIYEIGASPETPEVAIDSPTLNIASPSDNNNQRQNRPKTPLSPKASKILFKLRRKKKRKDGDNTNTAKDAPRRILINKAVDNMKVAITRVFQVGGEESYIKPQRFKFRTLKQNLFRDNRISTTVYWWWNFIPLDFIFLNLLYQYIYQLHNWYFLIVMIFSLIPGVSPVTPVSSVLPVVFILGVNMLKDFVEDLRRYINDRTANNRSVSVIRDGKRLTVRAGSLKVGEVVHLKSEDVVPADILVLNASNKGNKCYVETSQLDGEANMKPKFGRSSTAYLNSDEIAGELQGDITVNAPVKELDKVEGIIRFTNTQGKEVTETIGPENVVFKGCTIKNTTDVYGVCLYTGMESKVMLNTARKKKKRSFIDTRVNLILGLLVVLHQILVIIFTVLSSVYQVCNFSCVTMHFSNLNYLEKIRIFSILY